MERNSNPTERRVIDALMDDFLREYPNGESRELAEFMYKEGKKAGAMSNIRKEEATNFHLKHTGPDGKQTVRDYPTLAEAYRVMSGEYYDELKDDDHNALADDKDWSFVMSSTSAVVRWNKDLEYRWIIEPSQPKEQVYEIQQICPDGTMMTLATIRTADILAVLTALRSAAFDIANCGRHGAYPADNSFNDAVEEGFDDAGLSWTAEDGTVLKIVKKTEH